MISELTLINFKCFQKESMCFRPLTILTGANAAGKSSVLQALLLLQYTNEIVNQWYLDNNFNLISVGSNKKLYITLDI